MSVIERWLARKRDLVRVGDDWTADHMSPEERLQWVEIVPAEQLRGAVSVLEWLVSLDDPSVEARELRRSVSLGQIIERAREALGGQ